MCQILVVETRVKFAPLFFNSGEFSEKVKQHLDIKGGDYYSVALNFPARHIIENSFNGDPRNIDIKKYLEKGSFDLEEPVNILFFSRQQPEMENDNVEEQPYLKYNDDDDSLSMVAIHGTIYNDKELAKKYNLSINADTEIFKYLSIPDKEIKGTFAAISIKDEGNIELYEHGLKIWHKPLIVDLEEEFDVFIGNLFSTSNLDLFEYLFSDIFSNEYESRILIAAFSTGMDISLSAYKQIFDNSVDYEKVILTYFAWGSNAEDAEISKLKQFEEFFKKKIEEEELDIKVETRILDARNYFTEYFKITEAPIPKIASVKSVGIEEETESPLAYVPYRNSLFALILAAAAEAQELKNVDILFGLNLSEGMVFMDNSEGWLESVQSLIQLGGKDPDVVGTYRVVAPYFPRTKTNMLKEFKNEFGFAILEQLLEMSHSCYYPDKDGNPCGKCGSCILREKAIKKVL